MNSKRELPGRVPSVPVALIIVVAALLVTFACGREVLPAIAYVNRTIYPAIINYSARGAYPNLAIGLLSDVQYADREEKERRHFKLSLSKLQHAVREFNANRTHLDCVIHLGDLVDSDMKLYLPHLQPVLDELKYPLYQVLGNHDFLGMPEDSFDSVHKMLKMPARYYSLLAGPSKRYRLIMMDGNDLAFYSTVTGTQKRKDTEVMYRGVKNRRAKNAKLFNGGVGQEQMEWLKKELQAACDSGQLAFIFIHHPMRPKDEPTNLWNDIAMVPVITAYPCAAAVINGHAHKYLYDFHHTRHRHVHFITFGGMVQSPFTTFGFADIYDDRLHIHGLIFGREIDNNYNLSYHAPAASARSGAGAAADAGERRRCSGQGDRRRHGNGKADRDADGRRRSVRRVGAYRHVAQPADRRLGVRRGLPVAAESTETWGCWGITPLSGLLESDVRGNAESVLV
jgi:manganese-dependent ADP-ribose/CDP-alcohol diphosphatase